MRLISSARISIESALRRRLRLTVRRSLLLQLARRSSSCVRTRAVVDEAADLRDDAAEQGGVDLALERGPSPWWPARAGRRSPGGRVVERHRGGDPRADAAEVLVGERAERVRRSRRGTRGGCGRRGGRAGSPARGRGGARPRASPRSPGAARASRPGSTARRGVRASPRRPAERLRGSRPGLDSTISTARPKSALAYRRAMEPTIIRGAPRSTVWVRGQARTPAGSCTYGAFRRLV